MRKFFKREDLPHIQLATEVVDGKRFYRTLDGGLYPSVTTVLSAMKDKTHLTEWKKRIGEEEANNVMRKAAGRGTAMHYICEDYLNNKEDYIGGRLPTAIELFRNIQHILDDHVDLIYGNEIPLYSNELRTAGRTDMFCRFFGTNTIVDFKTSTRDKRVDWIEDYFLQSTAYAMMLEEVYKDLKPIFIPQIAIVIAVQEGEQKYQLFVKQTNDYREKVKKLFNDYHENASKN